MKLPIALGACLANQKKVDFIVSSYLIPPGIVPKALDLNTKAQRFKQPMFSNFHFYLSLEEIPKWNSGSGAIFKLAMFRLDGHPLLPWFEGLYPANDLCFDTESP